MILFDLFLGFLEVGFFAFGGAYGAIPLIRDVIMRYGWLDDAMLQTMIAVSEVTPGPIMVNLATFVGSSQAGFAGAALATLAVVLPSFFIILIVMAMLRRVLDNIFVQAILRGLKPCMVGMIIATGAIMAWKSCLAQAGDFSVSMRGVCVTALLIAFIFGWKRLFKSKPSPIHIITVSAILGMLIF